MRHIQGIKKPITFYSIGVIGFFYALHTALPSYFNSSFLYTFTDEKTVSFIYLIISTLTIAGLLSIHKALKRFGNYKVAITLILLQILTFYGLITQTSPNIVIALFIIEMCIVSFISLTIDIFLQKGTEINDTGTTRGMYMTVMNFAWILGPLLGGMIVFGNNYRGIYIFAFLILFPLIYLVYRNFNNFIDSKYIEISTRETLMRILRNKDITRIFAINIVLQTFYAWMVVYVPIYMHNIIGFNWKEISIIFTIMLLPFVLVEIPLGRLADRRWGEKEILAVGFIIMGIATGLIVFFTVKSLVAWAIILFITRIGAAAAEIMIETYFFKKIDGSDPEILSMFRITRPLSFFIAPLIVTISLVYMPMQYTFVVIGILCLLTLYPIATIRDTN